MLEAAALEAAERDKAANAIFASVWNAAEPLFQDGAPSVDACFVCATPVDKTASGSMAGKRRASGLRAALDRRHLLGIEPVVDPISPMLHQLRARAD